MFASGLALLFIGLSASCGIDRNETSTQVFSPRHDALFAADPQPGDLHVVVTNDISVVDVPSPHLPTVIHLNAKLCSVAPDSARKTMADDNGHSRSLPPTGKRKCIDLSPTIYYGTSASFVVARASYDSLLNEDFQQLEVFFQSSSQTTRLSYGCRNVRRTVEPRTDSVNEMHITVDGQHSLSFNCR